MNSTTGHIPNTFSSDGCSDTVSPKGSQHVDHFFVLKIPQMSYLFQESSKTAFMENLGLLGGGAITKPDPHTHRSECIAHGGVLLARALFLHLPCRCSYTDPVLPAQEASAAGSPTEALLGLFPGVYRGEGVKTRHRSYVVGPESNRGLIMYRYVFNDHNSRVTY
jgi:hypothetical protein